MHRKSCCEIVYGHFTWNNHAMLSTTQTRLHTSRNKQHEPAACRKCEAGLCIVSPLLHSPRHEQKRCGRALQILTCAKLRLRLRVAPRGE